MSAPIPRGGLRIAVFGLFHGTNLGNEATLEAAIAKLSSYTRDAQIFCISPEGAGSRKMPFVPIEALPVSRYFWRMRDSGFKRMLVTIARVLTEPFRYRRTIKMLQDVDLLIIGGTGVMDDFGQGALDLPMSLFRWTRAAVRSGTVVGYMSVGAGPVVSPLSRRFIVTAARLAHFRSYRDNYSKSYMRSLGSDVSTDEVVPDLVFGLTAFQGNKGSTQWPPRVIGLGIMMYRGWHQPEQVACKIYENYLQKLTEFTVWLAEDGYEVRLLVGDTKADPPVIDEILRRTGFHSNIFRSAIESVPDLLAELERTDLVVASRYHNLLLGLLAHRPAIAISYSSKCEALMDWAGLSDFCQTIETLDVKRLKDQFTSLAARPAPPIDRLRSATADAASLLEKQYERVLGLVKPRAE